MERSAAQTGTATGLTLMLIGVSSLSINDAIGKFLTDSYHPVQILFLRNLIALPIAIVIAWRMGGISALGTAKPVAHLVRGAMWLGASVSFFTGLSQLGLAEATVLIFAAPIFITALSATLLGEAVGWKRWAAVAAGFAGVLIVVRPGAATFQPASIYPLCAAFFYAALMISARWVDPRESVWTMMLYLVGGGALFTGLLTPLVWRPIDPGDLWLFLAIAGFGTVGMTMMTQAFRLAPAGLIAPLDYTALIWAAGLGWAVWGDVPDLATWIGAAIIIGSALVIVLRAERAAA